MVCDVGIWCVNVAEQLHATGRNVDFRRLFCCVRRGGLCTRRPLVEQKKIRACFQMYHASSSKKKTRVCMFTAHLLYNPISYVQVPHAVTNIGGSSTVLVHFISFPVSSLSHTSVQTSAEKKESPAPRGLRAASPLESVLGVYVYRRTKLSLHPTYITVGVAVHTRPGAWRSETRGRCMPTGAAVYHRYIRGPTSRRETRCKNVTNETHVVHCA